MDRDCWLRIMAMTRVAAKGVAPSVRWPVFSDLLIVRMYLWSVAHDRPLMWACQREHYGQLFRPRCLPSVSQFSRRIRTDSVQRILQNVNDMAAEVDRPTEVLIIDGKALPVSPVSKDPDAARGKVPGGFGKGYKLHAQITSDLRIIKWGVMPLNVSEQSVAAELLDQFPVAGSTLLGDGAYDSKNLHLIAAAGGMKLLTPLKAQNKIKNQKRYRKSLREMGPARREAVAVWKKQPALCMYVLKSRVDIERVFSALSCYGGGLGPLPAWVRTLERVRRWVGSKIILYHVRRDLRHRAKTHVAA